MNTTAVALVLSLSGFGCYGGALYIGTRVRNSDLPNTLIIAGCALNAFAFLLVLPLITRGAK